MCQLFEYGLYCCGKGIKLLRFVLMDNRWCTKAVMPEASLCTLLPVNPDQPGALARPITPLTIDTHWAIHKLTAIWLPFQTIFTVCAVTGHDEWYSNYWKRESKSLAFSITFTDCCKGCREIMDITTSVLVTFTCFSNSSMIRSMVHS